MKKINIILPVYNENESIRDFFNYLEEQVKELRYKFVITFVDDGSIDQTWKIIESLKPSNKNIELKKIKLLRNFGHQAALTCGMEEYTGDAVVLMDSDFQDDPVYIKEILNKFEEGAELVLARRIERNDGIVKNFLFSAFYKIQYYLSDIKIPKNVGHYSLISSEIVDRINQLPENNRYINGLRAYTSYEYQFIDVVRNKRKIGKSKMSFSQLLNLGLKGIFDYSTKPIRVIGYLGILISVGSILFSIFVFIKAQLFNEKVLNWDFGLSSIYFLSGLQLLSLSIIGEYIKIIFTEVKNRPIYIIEKKI